MSAAYDPTAWADFAVAAAVVTGVLAGLLLVAAAARPPLAEGVARTGLAVTTLLALVAAALAVLVPGQDGVALGLEVAVVGLALGIVAVTWISREQGSAHLLPVALAALTALALVVAGLSLETGSGGGLYWLLAAVAVGTAGAVHTAWTALLPDRSAP